MSTSFHKQTAVRRRQKHFTTTGIDSDSRKIGAMQESQGRLRTGLARGLSLAGFLLFSMVTATPRPRMTVILMSDPKGSDLRPYLSKVNKAILQAWMQAQHTDWAATGQVIIRFSVDRSGKILKLALISSSGVPDFDRSVADIVSSSGPLPPVPESFQGEQILLRLKFAAH